MKPFVCIAVALLIAGCASASKSVAIDAVKQHALQVWGKREYKIVNSRRRKEEVSTQR